MTTQFTNITIATSTLAGGDLLAHGAAIGSKWPALFAAFLCLSAPATDWGPLTRAQALEQPKSGQISAVLLALRAHTCLWRTQNHGDTAKDRRPGIGAGGRLQV